MGFVLGHAGPGCSAHVRGMRGGAELRGRGRGPTATPSRPHRRPPRRHSRSRSGLAAGSRPLTSLYVLCIYIHRRNKGIKKKKKRKRNLQILPLAAADADPGAISACSRGSRLAEGRNPAATSAAAAQGGPEMGPWGRRRAGLPSSLPPASPVGCAARYF